eukprot:1564149-Amphidinium_carterae.1
MLHRYTRPGRTVVSGQNCQHNCAMSLSGAVKCWGVTLSCTRPKRGCHRAGDVITPQGFQSQSQHLCENLQLLHAPIFLSFSDLKFKALKAFLQ